MEIINPNSSGQGFCAEHANHRFHAIALEFGYTYSHTTRIQGQIGEKSFPYFSHTYKHGTHNLSFSHHDCPQLAGIHVNGSPIWHTSVSCGSGHKWDGMADAELRAHLQSKSRRYGLKKLLK